MDSSYLSIVVVPENVVVQESSGDIEENPENENNYDIDEIIAQAHLNVPPSEEMEVEEEEEENEEEVVESMPINWLAATQHVSGNEVSSVRILTVLSL